MSFLSDANDITSEAITPDQQTAWYNIIGQFEARAQQFLSARQDLDSIDPAALTPDMQAQYQSLQGRAASIQNTITTVQNALADVKNALAGAWDAVTGVWSQAVQIAPLTSAANPAVTEGMSPMTAALLEGFGLGFLPLIPIAIVAAALAAMTYFLTDYGKFKTNAALVAQGKKPLSTGGLTSSVGTLVWIAAGIAALVLLPRLIGGYKEALR